MEGAREKKQFSPFSLSKCCWRFYVSQAPHDFGGVFNQCFGGGNKGPRPFVQFQRSSIDVHCDLPRQTWRQHLPQHQEASLALAMGWHNKTGGASAPRLQGAGFPLELSRWQQLGCPSPDKNLHQAPSSKSKGTFVLQENTLPATPNKL